MIKRTIIIWKRKEILEETWFFCLAGDYTYLDEIYVGFYDDEAQKHACFELKELVFTESGGCKVQMFNRFPHHLYVPGTTAVISAGIVS